MPVRDLMATTNAARIANDSTFCESAQDMKKLEDALICDEALNAPLHERMLRTEGRELMRATIQPHFDRRSAQQREIAAGHEASTPVHRRVSLRRQ